MSGVMTLGTETGHAITDVLYGDQNPSAKLPYTIARNVSDYHAHIIIGTSPTDIVKVNYTEG
jgi:beta-glucosidase